MPRLFYPLLFIATFASAAALWSGDPDARDATAAPNSTTEPIQSNHSGQWPLSGGITSPIPGPPRPPVNPARPISWPGAAANPQNLESQRAAQQPTAQRAQPPQAYVPAAPADAGRPYVAGPTMPAYPTDPRAAAPAVSSPRAMPRPTSAHSPYAFTPAQPNGGMTPVERLPAVDGTGRDFAAPDGPYVPSPLKVATPAERVPIPQSPELYRLEGTEIIARVGDQVILAGEVVGFVNAMMAENADRIPAHKEDEIREQLIRQRLQPMIETKIILEDVRRTLPPEALDRVLARVGDDFERREVKQLMERSDSATRAQLEEKLNEVGSSIDQKKREFSERMLARQWVREQVQLDDYVTHQEMLDYYHEHQEDFAVAARAKWQQLTIETGRFQSQQDAYQQIAALGNNIWSGGSFDDIARKYSHGTTAEQGGLYDWTTQGSLVCTEIDRYLFTAPIGALSPIIRDGNKLHIVRVLEREDAGYVPFSEAQVKIQEKIREKRIIKQTDEFLAELKDRTRVWTVFDDEQPSSHLAEPPNHSPPAQRY